MNYLSKMKFNFGMIVSAVLGIPVGIVGGINIAEKYEQKEYEKYQNEFERYSDVLPFLSTNKKGFPLRADVSKDITVKLNLTEQEIEHAINAINDLDDISKNVNYTILDNKDKSIYADIQLYSIEDMADSTHALGRTHYTYNNKTGYINYPITITLDKKCLNYTSENGVNLLNYVVKHEMMHTLGFTDLYDTKYYNKSIMWHNVWVNIDDFTGLDKYNIQKMYDNDEITVTKPANISFATQVIKKEKEVELEM